MRPQTLTDCQVLLDDPKLTKVLEWEQRGNVVIAKPKHRLSPTVFREILRKFRRMGGRYEGYVGFTVKLETNRGGR